MFWALVLHRRRLRRPVAIRHGDAIARCCCRVTAGIVLACRLHSGHLRPREPQRIRVCRFGGGNRGAAAWEGGKNRVLRKGTRVARQLFVAVSQLMAGLDPCGNLVVAPIHLGEIDVCVLGKVHRSQSFEFLADGTVSVQAKMERLGDASEGDHRELSVIAKAGAGLACVLGQFHAPPKQPGGLRCGAPQCTQQCRTHRAGIC